MANENEFPRPSGSLLTEEEKTFLDDAPDDVVALFFEYPQYGYVVKHTNTEGVGQYEFLGDRAVAVRDYYEMLFAHDIRHDVRLNEAP